LLRIVKLVRTDISRLNRATLEALIVLDVHNKDVVKGLIEAEVTSIYDFDYEAQLRYYWEVNDDPNNLEGKRDTSVKIINNVLQYNYEYLGNSSRLVITPLTDRCYRTLCGAIGSNYGGAPEGPAGTGKTETVKDLAKALARMIIVFNCTGGLTYQDMGRFFKGLSCTGGWSCLDEFNRINLEVLSVISQQLQCIQNAIKLNKTEFDFMDSRIKLKNTCNCFITMNPGYAGRSDLPDNLKALFRSVAMMVPDYSMIGQIRLYSFGFADAESLSKKIVTTYKLSSEQISAQKHYDYGMRAVNSVLVAAGNLKKKSPNEAEDVQILKAINEVNQAKFLDVDLPLFNAITKDLFPETILPALDLSKLLECVDEVIIKRNLQGLPYFIEKVVQLYQMILVRHGLMVVGVPYGGKTTCVDVLADALALLQEKYKEEKPVEIITINPKAVSYKQLYGFSDIATGEWTDGVLPTKFKKLANPEDDSPDMRRWLLFDGPVDALWIEDMNTVLDDNKKLCLTNGDVFFMSNDMNLVFETMDLLVASPATVSRCGMIFFEADVLGWMHLYESWKKTLPKAIDSFDHAEMDIYFTNIMTPIIKMLQKGQLEQTAPTSVHNIITTLLGIAYKFLKEFEDPAMAQGMEFKERRSYFDKVFTYATIWSLGATMTNDFRLKFDAAFKKFINVADPKLDPELQKKHRKIELPEGGSGRVFDFLLVKYVEETEQEKRIGLRWVRWSDFVASDPEFPSNMLPNEITIQTVDTVRYSHLINMYIEEQKNVLVCGPTGTGKTIYVKKLLRGLDKKQYQTLEVGFSAQTTASQVQTIIDTPLFRRPGKNTWGPPTGKKLVVFVDDFNMPKKEKEGAQPPIELMRQLIDKKGWYDNNEKSKPFKHIHDLIFVAAMGQPGPSSNLITPRVQRLMSLISFTIIDDVQMETIFKHILNWKFTQANKFEDVVAKVSPQLVKATLQIYSSVIGFFKPLPSKSHYLFNLRDFAKVINGLCLADKDKIKTKEMVVKLWIHEVWRVFGDRLNSEQDRLHLMNEFLKKVTHKVLGENFDNLLADLSSGKQGKIESLNEMRGLVFTDVLHPAAMKNRPYELVSEPEKLLKACSNALKQYDLMSDKPLNIVLFNFAIEHLLIISRILKQPGSNALLIGIGGSGRQSLTRLASKMGEFGVFQIELSNTYGVEEWKDDLKSTLKAAGGKNETTVFIFRDNQIKMESFIEDVNNLLNNGEVPNLFLPEEQGEIFEFARKNAKEQERDDVETSEQLMSFFIETCKKKLHVVLNFSPIGDNFRNKIRMFPSLVNCCTIDWFFEWPQDALVSVAESFIGQTELSSQIKAKCVDMVQYFHTNTKEKAAEFLLNLKRYYYVTPTSFIEMIGQFKSLLEEKNESVLRQQKKYENGYKMIIEAESSVSIMQANLNDLVPKLEESSKRVAIIVEETNIAKEKAEVVKIVVTKEELIASEKAAKAKVISDECTADMALVIPEIEKSLDALNNLDPKQFEILRTANVLPDALEEASKCLAIITKQNQEKKMNTTTMKQETDWTKTRKKMYMDVRGLLNMMKTFNGLELGKEIDISKEINILDEKTFKLIETEFETCADLLNIGKIRNASDAVGEIFLWIEGQRKLYPTELAARPKRAKFLAAKAEYDEAMSTLAIKQRELREKEQEVDALVRNLEMNNKIKMDLEANYKKCKIQLERAELLITNLADEKGRWKDLAEQLKVEYDNLVGDVLISAGMISYLGPFTSGYRSVISKDWSQLSLKMNIPGSKEFSFVKTMGEPVKIRAWQINGLPADDFSTENAIILNKSRRWSLCIDPQLQANKWIKSSEKERKLIITNPTINFMQDIERAIRQGLPCLLENVTTEIEPALDPILLKQIVRSGGSGTIKLGDKIVDYDDRFFLFITTKLRNPHYLPEVSTKLTIINFMITFEGLSDQLLGTVVSMEMPKQEAEKNRLIAEGAQNKKELMELENEILQILSLPKDKLLEDEDAINVLTKSKKKSETIKEKQKISEVTEQEINEARKNYIEISKTTSCLFFAITDLNAIDPMYQYSLTYFMQLFRSSIDNSDKPSDITERLSAIETHFLYNLYVNISRSLFVKDKLLLSFLLCVRTQIYKGEITEEAYSFFLTGATGAVQNKINQPKKITWMKESMWLDICKLSEFEGVFSNIHKNFEMNLDDWSRIYESNDPLAESFPPSYAARLTNFDRMLLIRVLRPDKIVPFIQKYVIDNLGQKFIEIPPFSLEAVYKDSTEQTPLIFVLTPGVDPYNSLLQFANQREIKLEGVSLGQGQGPTAERLIKDASENGYWVVLQNCHLAQSFMNPLEKKCEELLLSNKIDPKFRLWLTSYPSTDFPTSVLQNGIKMTNEPPSGLRNNLKAAIYNTEVVSFFNDSTQPQIYHRLLFGLCFFHAVIQERKVKPLVMKRNMDPWAGTFHTSSLSRI
jgi:dynein heavy chain